MLEDEFCGEKFFFPPETQYKHDWRWGLWREWKMEKFLEKETEMKSWSF